MKRKLFADWNLTLLEPDETTPSDPSGDTLSFHSRALGRDVAIEPTLAHQPDGIRATAVAAGIKYPDVLDFTVVKLDAPGSAAGLFTTNLCPGHSIPFDREVLADGCAQALVVVSKNANVFTPRGDEDTRVMARCLAEELGVSANDVIVSCTGVIGVPLPMDKVRAAISGIAAKLQPNRLDDVSRAILTTDRGAKVCSVRVGDAIVCAMAKGAGMIEPNMATMLAYFFTNADLDGPTLHGILVDAADRSFNALSVDSDTSTSDSLIVFSTRRVRVDDALRSDLVDAFRAMSVKLARQITVQAEGATKLIECTVHVDTSVRDAKLMAKKIVNSPLVKTAVHGGDPNWGRLVMAIGKPDERLELRAIPPSEVTLSMMGQKVFERSAAIPLDLATLAKKIKTSSRIGIDARIGEGKHSATVWGCDLSHRYVDINADYTT